MSRYVEIQSIRHGQPRPYADHEFVSRFIFTRDDYRVKEWLTKADLPTIVPDYVTREFAHQLARMYCPYKDSTDPKFNWASPQLVTFMRIKPTPPAEGLEVDEESSDRWEIHIREAYTD